MTDETSKPCTVKQDSPCPACPLPDKIHCRWNRQVLNGFFAIAFPAFIGTLVLLVMFFFITGHWWPIVFYFILIIVIFTCEIKFLCSHCPYYAADEKILKCLGNNGALKIWKCNPAPMTGGEKTLMKLLVAIFYLLIPVITTVVVLGILLTGPYDMIVRAGAAGVAILTLWSCWSFITIMKAFYCSKCVNFSCPLNTVKKQVVDDYLRKNDVMREAWEKSGYKPD